MNLETLVLFMSDRDNGATIADLKAKYNLTYQEVTCVLKEHGDKAFKQFEKSVKKMVPADLVPPPPPPQENRTWSRQRTAWISDSAIAEDYKTGMTAENICKKHGISIGAVYRAVDSAGVPRRHNKKGATGVGIAAPTQETTQVPEPCEPKADTYGVRLDSAALMAKKMSEAQQDVSVNAIAAMFEVLPDQLVAHLETNYHLIARSPGWSSVKELSHISEFKTFWVSIHRSYGSIIHQLKALGPHAYITESLNDVRTP